MKNVEAVQETCSDAASCKNSACRLGYYDDPFIHYFVTKQKYAVRKMPLINRGYFARVAAMDKLITLFLDQNSGQETQIISLGAGHDTTFFRLKQRNLCTSTNYFELDFPTITQMKLMAMRKNEPFRQILNCANRREFDSHLAADCTEFHSKDYHLIACDLRDLDDTNSHLEAAGISWDAPTLIISECVLIYMDIEHSNGLIKWANEKLLDVSFVVYEQILPNDRFGQVMISNLQQRGCELCSISNYPDAKAQETRFKSMSYEFVQCWDMNDIYYKFIDQENRKMKEKVEMLDELEEFHLFQSHYCITIASKSAESTSSKKLKFC